MSTPPTPPERLGKILLEILALSGSARTGQSESASGDNPGKISDADGVDEQSERPAENNNGQTP
jgi:hypothetical protein